MVIRPVNFSDMYVGCKILKFLRTVIILSAKHTYMCESSLTRAQCQFTLAERMRIAAFYWSDNVYTKDRHRNGELIIPGRFMDKKIYLMRPKEWWYPLQNSHGTVIQKRAMQWCPNQVVPLLDPGIPWYWSFLSPGFTSTHCLLFSWVFFCIRCVKAKKTKDIGRGNPGPGIVNARIELFLLTLTPPGGEVAYPWAHVGFLHADQQSSN